MGLLFNGGNTEAVDAGSDPSVDDIWVGGATVMGWLHLQTLQWAAGDIIACKGSLSLVNATINDGWFLGPTTYTAWNALAFSHSAASSGDMSWRTPTGSIVASTWYHCACTCNKTTPTTAPVLYLNGVAQTLTQYNTTTKTPESDAAYNLRLGANYRTPLESIDGTLADVRLYSRILSAAEIASIHAQRGRDRIVGSLAARYSLNGAHGSGPVGAGSIRNLSPLTPLNDAAPIGTPAWAPDVVQQA